MTQWCHGFETWSYIKGQCHSADVVRIGQKIRCLITATFPRPQIKQDSASNKGDTRDIIQS